MKRVVIAAAALAAVGSVHAQSSSVTIWGILDEAVQRISADGAGSLTRLQSNGMSTSQLGFRAIEDLGAGWSAGFWLEAQIAPDSGGGVASNTNNQLSGAGPAGLNWNRRSTVSLITPYGEVRLGRDASPAFWNFSVFDPFQTNGLGNSLQMVFGAGIGTSANIPQVVSALRVSNSVGYFLPKSFGNVYGQAMVAFGENGDAVPNGTKNDGNYTGARLGYTNGVYNIAVGGGNTTYVAGDYRQVNVGGSWDFGFVRMMFQWDKDSVQAATRRGQTAILIGGIVPVAPSGEVRFSLIHTDVDNTPNDADLVAVGYDYLFSKRTKLYATYGRVNNKGTGTLFSVGRSPTEPGGTSSGVQIGMTHQF